MTGRELRADRQANRAGGDRVGRGSSQVQLIRQQLGSVLRARAVLDCAGIRGIRRGAGTPPGEATAGERVFDGDGQTVSPTLSAKQYGLLKETHVDADPNMVMSLVGSDGDLLDFIPGIITRTNTPGVYQDLVTRNGGGSHGCPVCSYDPLGNVLSTTDARGFTTIFDRSEMGEVYRTTIIHRFTTQ